LGAGAQKTPPFGEIEPPLEKKPPLKNGQAPKKPPGGKNRGGPPKKKKGKGPFLWGKKGTLPQKKKGVAPLLKGEEKSAGGEKSHPPLFLEPPPAGKYFLAPPAGRGVFRASPCYTHHKT